MPKNDETIFLTCLLEVGPLPKGIRSDSEVGFRLVERSCVDWYEDVFEPWYDRHFDSRDRLNQYEWEHRYLTWIKKQSI